VHGLGRRGARRTEDAASQHPEGFVARRLATRASVVTRDVAVASEVAGITVEAGLLYGRGGALGAVVTQRAEAVTVGAEQTRTGAEPTRRTQSLNTCATKNIKLCKLDS
jgi:hypothetical protein